jgi:hypothetical protein
VSTLRFLDRLSTLEACWSVLDREPGMDNLMASQDMLDQMIEAIKIYPFVDTDREYRLFLGRFEFPKYGEDFKFSEAAAEGSCGFIDFLAGFPIDCVEMLVGIGDRSSLPGKDKISKVFVDEGTRIFPTVPTTKLFKWPDAEFDKIFENFTAITVKDVSKFLAKNLEGEVKPRSPKWWFRVQLREKTANGNQKKYPVPGEFFGLGCRIWPGKYWGHQKSNPFVYSGNWMDTIYYSGAIITEVIEPTDAIPYTIYKIKWHGKKDEFTIFSSDFAMYQKDDRVTLIKDVDTTKKTQLWKDNDMKYFGGQEDVEDNRWQIVPVTFYGLEKEGE